MASPLIIAHRTAPPYAPENSLEGVRVAFEQGADAVEIDLRLSLNQSPFLMHDRTMWRTTGWPLPLEITPSFIAARLRLKGGIERLPSLKAALNLLPAEKLVAIDVKTHWAVPGLQREIEQRSLSARTLVWSSSSTAVREAVRRDVPWEVAYYKDYEDGPSNRAFIDKARRLGAQAVSLDWRAIDGELVAYAHDAGLRVYSWHKDYELTPQKLASGLDGLITDHPARARQAITTLSAG